MIGIKASRQEFIVRLGTTGRFKSPYRYTVYTEKILYSKDLETLRIFDAQDKFLRKICSSFKIIDK